MKVLDFAPFRGSYVSRLFTVLYFSVRSSRSRALRYGLPILHECQNYLGGRGGLGGSEAIFLAPLPPPRTIIPDADARPLGTFENQDNRDGKTRYI